MEQTIKMEIGAAWTHIKEKVRAWLETPVGMDFWAFLLFMLISACAGGAFGYFTGYNACEQALEESVAVIRIEAIEEYKQALEEQKAAESAEKTLQMMDEGAKRKAEATRLAQLFEAAREFNFDHADLITYGLCVYNRMSHPEFGGTFDDILNQPGQWLGYNSEKSYQVISDYYKTAEKVVDIYYNADTRPISQRYAWIEIIDGQLYLKDSFTNTPTTHYWRYSE